MCEFAVLHFPEIGDCYRLTVEWVGSFFYAIHSIVVHSFVHLTVSDCHPMNPYNYFTVTVVNFHFCNLIL